MSSFSVVNKVCFSKIEKKYRKTTKPPKIVLPILFYFSSRGVPMIYWSIADYFLTSNMYTFGTDLIVKKVSVY